MPWLILVLLRQGLKYKYLILFISIDATKHVGYGRKVNDVYHPKEANCAMKVVIIRRRPHLCLFTTKDIQSDCKLRFDYGVDMEKKVF